MLHEYKITCIKCGTKEGFWPENGPPKGWTYKVIPTTVPEVYSGEWTCDECNGPCYAIGCGCNRTVRK